MTIDPRLHRIVTAQPYPLLFATISGAHLYGFPAPDLDFDLRGAHVLPLEKVIGLEVREETVEQEMIVPPHPGPFPIGCDPGGALEMDIVSHDVRKFFGLLLKKNGYVLEQLFSPLIVHTTPEHEELKAICRAHPSPRPSPLGEERVSEGWVRGGGVITKHHSHHYFGFAETQWKLFLKGEAEEEMVGTSCRSSQTEAAQQRTPYQRPRRVKPLLYVYRVLLTGIHLMRTGEVEANLVTLNEEFRLPYIADLVGRKLAGPEKSKLEDADIAFHESEYHRLREELQAAHDASRLPELPSDETRAALNDLLVRVRLKGRDHGAAI